MSTRYIVNHSQLYGPDGEPYTNTELKCPPGCNGDQRCQLKHEGECCLLQDDKGRSTGCQRPSHVTRSIPTVAAWLKTAVVILGRAAQANLTLDDGVHASDVLRALNRTTRAAGTKIRLTEQDYDWLLKVLFDDGETRRLLASKDTPDIKGVFAIKVFDPTLAVELRRVLRGDPTTQPDDMDTGDGSEDGDDED